MRVDLVTRAVRLFDFLGQQSSEGRNIHLRQLEVLESILPSVPKVTDGQGGSTPSGSEVGNAKA